MLIPRVHPRPIKSEPNMHADLEIIVSREDFKKKIMLSQWLDIFLTEMKSLYFTIC
jgi:hypothetical protein